MYDWIVVGNGVTGAAVSYELARVGFSVLVLEQNLQPQSATRYSYGGIAFWSGTTPLMRELCQAGIERHRRLSAELEGDTQFRELDLMLTIAPDSDPEAIAATYSQFAIPPQLISAEAACEMEPLLNREAIAAALTVKHGNVDPVSMVKAYNQAFVRAGGEILFGEVVEVVRQGDRIEGVKTPTATYSAANVLICTGGLTRSLLQSVQISVPVYFTHAELIETPSVDLRLQTLVMPAEAQRFDMEAKAGRVETDFLWDQPGQEITQPILDVGAVQFQDGRLRMGQISRALSDPQAQIDATQSEAEIRAGLGQILPDLHHVPGEWCRCLVAFTGDRLPLIGPLPDVEGLYLFSGFSNPFAILPPLAERFAQQVNGQTDPSMTQLAPSRFGPAPASRAGA